MPRLADELRPIEVTRMQRHTNQKKHVRTDVPDRQALRNPNETREIDAPPSIRRSDLAALASLIAGGAMALSIDVGVSRAMIKDDVLHGLHQTLEALEPFGHPVAILLILAAVFACHPAVRRQLPHVALTMFAGGMLANLFKIMVARIRPYHFDFSGGAIETFQGFLPGVTGGSRVQSCPSAHVATAVAAALALGTVYPKGRRVFAFIAGCVALHRIQTGAHYLSDTFWGAAVGYLGWMLMYRTSFPGGWFDRNERKWFAETETPLSLPMLIRTGDRTSDREAARNSGIGESRQTDADSPRVGNGRHTMYSEATMGIGRFRRLSVVIPVYDEWENVPLLYAELDAVLDAIPLEREILLVDDGSTDGTGELLREIAERDHTVRVVSFARNLGQAAALAAGIERATGDVIATLDADLQNDPRDLAQMIARLARGCDMVHGWRKNRRDRWFDRRLPSMVANRLISFVGGYRVHDTGCTLKVMRADLARRLPLFEGMHRFIPVLAHALGGICMETIVHHRAREFGRSKYGLSRTLHVLADLPRLWYVTRFLRANMQTLHSIGDAVSNFDFNVVTRIEVPRERVAA